MSQHLKLRALCEGAIFVAIAYILGLLKVWQMPQGGSVSLMMLPVLIYSLRWGVKSGLLAGCALGIIEFIIDNGIAISWLSFLGDYVIACALIGLAGLFRSQSKGWGVFMGIVVGSLGRWVSIWVTGATLWGQYMPENFSFLAITNNVWAYSFWYNLPTMVSGLVCLIVGSILFALPALRNYFIGSDIQK